MSARARAEFDATRFGIKIAVQIGQGDTFTHYARFDGVVIAEPINEAGATVNDDAFLAVEEDVARAIYDALGDYFGHALRDCMTGRFAPFAAAYGPDETCPNGCERYGDWWVPEDCATHLGGAL